MDSSSCSVAVCVLSQALIKPTHTPPSHGQHEEALFLSALDIRCRSMPYNRRVLFYRVDREEYVAFTDRLRQSLASALAEFYPLAGRLREGRVDGQEKRLEVHCNDMGPEFVEAEIHVAGPGGEMVALDLEELARGGFQTQAFFRDLTRWPSYDYLHDEGTAPLLSVQVTRFKGDGISVGVSMTHVLADGSSLWHFMTSWAEYARCEPLTMHAVHMRTLMKVQEPSKEKAVLESVEYIEDDTSGKPEDSPKVERVFQFNKEMLRALKERASLKCSTYEALCAHIWKCTSKARGHAHNKRVGFISVANMRRRMEPPLPHGYFGNCLTWGSASALAGELEHEDLSTTVVRIRRAVASCNNSSIQGLLHTLEIYGESPLHRKSITNGARMRVSSSFKFPTFDVDFGWGRPLATRSAETEELGKIVFYPGSEGLGSADVCIALPLHTMQALEKDVNFFNPI